MFVGWMVLYILSYVISRSCAQHQLTRIVTGTRSTYLMILYYLKLVGRCSNPRLSAVLDAWASDRSSQDMWKTVFSTTPPGKYHRENEEDAWAEVEDEADVDEIVEKLRRNPGSDEHEHRLLGSIVDTGALCFPARLRRAFDRQYLAVKRALRSPSTRCTRRRIQSILYERWFSCLCSTRARSSRPSSRVTAWQAIFSSGLREPVRRSSSVLSPRRPAAGCSSSRPRMTWTWCVRRLNPWVLD